MEIHILSFQSEQYILHIHKTDETSDSNFEKTIILYLDNMLIMAPMKEEVRKHLATGLELLIALGFVINTKKGVTHPDQVMEFLGFVLDSKRMSFSVPNFIQHNWRCSDNSRAASHRANTVFVDSFQAAPGYKRSDINQ